jgi:hypothetical protein
VQNLLGTYKHRLRPPQKVVVDEVIGVIEDLFTVTVPVDRVQYKPNEKCVYLNLSGVLKTEILLQKKEVLAHIQGRLGVGQSPTDIR